MSPSSTDTSTQPIPKKIQAVVAYTRLRQVPSDYREPSFDEMLRLCTDFGLVTEFRATKRGIRICCVNQTFDVSADEAELLLQGLILGFFYGHSRDDLSLAHWET
jgi:hypothetical protein